MLRKTLQNFIFDIIHTISTLGLFWDHKQNVYIILENYYFLRFDGGIATLNIVKNPEVEID